jgi:hypothetical protein
MVLIMHTLARRARLLLHLTVAILGLTVAEFYRLDGTMQVQTMEDLA